MQKFSLCMGMKRLPRKTLAKMSAYYTTTKSFTGVMLRQTDAGAADQAHFKSTKNKFVQALYNNLVERFSNTEILTAVQVLDVKLFCRRSPWNELCFSTEKLLNYASCLVSHKTTLLICY